ncbi:hypothetical protein Tco_0309015 [Tanacetum coccineum]
MTTALEKKLRYIFSKECIEAYWRKPVEEVHPRATYRPSTFPRRYTNASKTMTEAQAHYNYNEKELLAESDDTDELDQERDLLASLIEKLKCEIDDNKNRNKFLESSNQALVNKLKGLKKFQTELDKYHDVNYASKVAIDCAKAKGDLMSYKIESEKSSNEYTRKINDLNQIISDMKKELFAHQETISIISQEKEVWICQISQEFSQKRTRERMSDQEAKEIKAEAREFMPQPSTVNCKKPQLDTIFGIGWLLWYQEGVLELLVSIGLD